MSSIRLSQMILSECKWYFITHHAPLSESKYLTDTLWKHLQQKFSTKRIFFKILVRIENIYKIIRQWQPCSSPVGAQYSWVHFLMRKRLFTGVEICILYHKVGQSWSSRDKGPISVAKASLHSKKVLLSIWWN